MSSQQSPPVPLKVFSVSEIVTAAIILVLHKRELPYVGCRYFFDVDEYRFLFRDEHAQGAALLAAVRRSGDPLVRAREFRVALKRVHWDFRQEQKRVGNPNSAAGGAQ